MGMDANRRIRFLAFNAVGLGGIAVQLGVLALLTRGSDVGVAAATMIAVEAALLHNFVWHQRWTWADRRTSGARPVLSRLARFHAANGLLSLAGNVTITTALASTGVPPLLANLAAIAVCSLLNFAASEWSVFRVAAVAAAATLTPAPAAAQDASALAAWTNYTEAIDRRHAEPGRTFFALDEYGVRGWRERALAGAVPMHEVEAPGVDGGSLHHWAGAVRVKHTTVDAVVRRLQAYAGRESEFYEDVTASRLLEQGQDRLRVFLRLRRDAGPLTVHYNTEHAVHYRRLDGGRAASRSVSTRIAELADAGTAREREKTPGDDHGFLWRLHAYWRFEQVGTDVLIECESVSLSRSIPFVLRPIAGPISGRIARESLQRTLTSLRLFLEGGTPKA